LRVEEKHSWYSTGTMENGHDDIAGTKLYREHLVDANGLLLSYKTGTPQNVTVLNNWQCNVFRNKNFSHPVNFKN
jgi:hypothetical protein